MIIDRHAPLTARKEMVVAAPVDVVWNIQTDIERWPEWQPDISSISLEGTFGSGRPLPLEGTRAQDHLDPSRSRASKGYWLDGRFLGHEGYSYLEV